jgi:hypothetical protein
VLKTEYLEEGTRVIALVHPQNVDELTPFADAARLLASA